MTDFARAISDQTEMLYRFALGITRKTQPPT